jgi:hypothetical protein
LILGVYRNFVVLLAAGICILASGGPTHAKAPNARASQKKAKTPSPSYSAIDEANMDLADDESNFASARPEKHRAAAARNNSQDEDDPGDTLANMAHALGANRSPSSSSNRNLGTTPPDLTPFTDLEMPK